MFLCSLCGNLFDNNNINQKVTLKQDILDNPKKLDLEVCVGCFNLCNYEYKIDGKDFIIPRDKKIKIYKITSSTFETKDKKKDNEEITIVNDISKMLKHNVKKKYKDF